MNVTIHGRTQHFRTVSFDAKSNSVRLIEQRLLPHEFKIVATRDFKETAVAIRDMVVRGAGAIGATAAYGLAQGALAFRGENLKKAKTCFEAALRVWTEDGFPEDHRKAAGNLSEVEQNLQSLEVK